MLQSVLDPSELEKHLNKALSPITESVQVIRVQSLASNHKKRCVVTLVLQTPAGKREFIGKVYSTDRADVYRTMQRIDKSLFGAQKHFAIPRTFAFVPHLNLLLQEKIVGMPATKIFQTGTGEERATAAVRCAQWLARFHAYGPAEGEEVFVLTNDLLRAWAERIKKRVPAIKKAQLLFQRLEFVGAKQRDNEVCPSHGGYWHKQIMLTEDGVVVIDWDNHCLASACRDVAKFMVELQQLALKSLGSIRALDSVAEVFYRTYLKESRFQLEAGLAFYKAATCLRRAQSHLRRDGGGKEMAEATLDEGLRVLDEEL